MLLLISLLFCEYALHRQLESMHFYSLLSFSNFYLIIFCFYFPYYCCCCLHFAPKAKMAEKKDYEEYDDDVSYRKNDAVINTRSLLLPTLASPART